MDSGEKGINLVEITIITSRKEYWSSPGIERASPVFKSCTLPTEPLGSVLCEKAASGLEQNICRSNGKKDTP